MNPRELGHTQIGPLGATEGSNAMGIGLGVVLLLIGLVLVSGVTNFDIGAVDDRGLGWIFIIVGVLAIVLGLVMNNQRTRSTRVVEERRVDPPV
jgi:uncharacterized membrane protein HdeD (DUF308 family)